MKVRMVKRWENGVLHKIPVANIYRHNVLDGAAGCWCEPYVESVLEDTRGNVIERVVVHQKIMKAS